MSLLILLVAAVILLQVSAARRGPLVGEWQLIKNLRVRMALSDPYVREIAEFAVKVHNDDAKTGLVLKKVVKGEEQIVAGSNYKLVVEVVDGADRRSFEVVMWDKPWEHVRRLSSFKAVPGNA